MYGCTLSEIRRPGGKTPLAKMTAAVEDFHCLGSTTKHAKIFEIKI